MKINLHKTFIKHFDKRIKPNKNLLNKFNNRYQLYIKNKAHPLKKDHKLTADMKGKRAFNITGDIRVVYREVGKDTVEFLDIGSHPQVYGE